MRQQTSHKQICQVWELLRNQKLRTRIEMRVGTFQKVAGTGEAHLKSGDSPERWCEQGEGWAMFSEGETGHKTELESRDTSVLGIGMGTNFVSMAGWILLAFPSTVWWMESRPEPRCPL